VDRGPERRAAERRAVVAPPRETPGTTVPAARDRDNDATVSWGASDAGVASAAGRDVVTVLFTDIVGSTALTERLGDERWVEVLSAHDAAVRTALRTFGGEEVKTTGDGFLAVFVRAADAVRAGMLARRLVGALRVPEVPEGLSIRVGAHSGTVIRRDGDVLGRNVHMARRVTAAAAAGEVLVSASVRLAAGSDDALRTGPPRTLSFDGVAEPQVVFSVVLERGDDGGATVHVLDPARRRATEAPGRTR
jgi:adenylate cyclase